MRHDMKFLNKRLKCRACHLQQMLLKNFQVYILNKRFFVYFEIGYGGYPGGYGGYGGYGGLGGYGGYGGYGHGGYGGYGGKKNKIHYM